GLLPMPNVDARIGRLSGQAPSNTIDYIPPAEVPHKTKHEYSIKAVEIKAWNGNAWVDYRPYAAMSPPDALAALNANPSAFKDGRQEETVLFRASGGPGTVIDWNSQFGISRSLTFPNEATAQVVFNKPCVNVDLKLTTFSSGAVIRFYKRETMDAGFVYSLVE